MFQISGIKTSRRRFLRHPKSISPVKSGGFLKQVVKKEEEKKEKKKKKSASQRCLQTAEFLVILISSGPLADLADRRLCCPASSLSFVKCCGIR